jgi:hypothetical protein
MKDAPIINDTLEIKTLNRWLITLAVVIILWAAGIIMYVDKRTSPSDNHPLPIIMVDADTGKVIDPAYTNLFNNSLSNDHSKPVNMSDVRAPNNATKSLFEQKEHYNIRDFVVINYFYVEGIVIDRVGDEYIVMYKDHNHVLQKLSISAKFLLSPTSQNSVSPVSLLID